MAANHMAQGGVEKFMDEHAELFGRRVLGHELGIEEEAASIRRRRLDSVVRTSQSRRPAPPSDAPRSVQAITAPFVS